MPIFDYHCDNCGHLFEKIVSTSDVDKDQKCPKCEYHKTSKKMTTSVNLRFKGDWFTNNKTY